MDRDHIELSGRVHEVTAKAVHFHISMFQTRDVPEEARGRKLWFPRRRVVLFKHDGAAMLSVSKRYLLEKIAEEGPVAEVNERALWWVA